MNRVTACVVVFAASVFAGRAAEAQQTSLGLGKHDASAPIEVSSNTFQADMNAKTGTYIGNVVVKQGDFRLRADRVRVNVSNGKPEQIVANGGVVLQAPSGDAQGDDGVYDVGPRLITLTGRVILTKQKNVMRGTKLVVNLVTGLAQLGANGMAGGGRVQALFTPPPQQNSRQPSGRSDGQ